MIAVTFLGCRTVGPDFGGAPVPVLGPDFQAASGMSETPHPVPMADPVSFWSSFSDPILDQLVAQSLANNLTVRQAAERILEARANLQLNGAQRRPNVDSVGQYSFSKQSLNAQPFVGPNGNSFNLFTSGFDSTWEIDLFGRIRRSIEAAEAELETQHATLADVQQTLTADVASSYFTIRLLQEKISILESSIELQKQTAALVDDRLDAGISTELDREQTKAFLHRTQGQRASLAQQLDLEFNRLSLLLGEAPSDELRIFVGLRNVPSVSMTPDLGIPADLLRRRPDVRQAEAEVHAATARIGIAEADLYPSLTLLGSISLSAKSVSQMFQTESLAFNVGPSLRWNILHFGRICDNIEIQNARLKQILAQYEQAVLVAVKEVEDGLIKYQGYQTQQMSFDQARIADAKAVELSLERYRAGKANFQRVLDTQLQLLEDSQSVAATRANSLIELVRIYKATGGGWPGPTSDASELIGYRHSEIFIHSQDNPGPSVLEAGGMPDANIEPQDEANQWKSLPNFFLDEIGHRTPRVPTGKKSATNAVPSPQQAILLAGKSSQSEPRNRYPLGQGHNASTTRTNSQANSSLSAKSDRLESDFYEHSRPSQATYLNDASSRETAQVEPASFESTVGFEKETETKSLPKPPSSIWESQPIPNGR